MSALVQIRIQGRAYTLRTHQPEGQIRKVASFVEKKLAEAGAGKSVDTIDLMILTLLNLAGEHLQMMEQKEAEQQHIDKCLDQLNHQLTLEIDDNFGCQS